MNKTIIILLAALTSSICCMAQETDLFLNKGYNYDMKVYDDTLFVASENGVFALSLKEGIRAWKPYAFDGMDITTFVKSGQKMIAVQRVFTDSENGRIEEQKLLASYDYGWNTANEYFYGSHVNMLDSNINSIFLNICCLTGDIEYSQCMMKDFLFANNGAVAFVGATNISLNDGNSAFNLLFYNNLLNNNSNRIGDCILGSHIQNINSMGTNALINAYMYIIGSDPSLEIWTDCPQTFGDVAINANGNNICITTGIQDFTIRLVSEDGNNINEQNINGSSFTITLPTSNTYLFFSKNGYAPYILYLNVTDNYIQNVTFNENYALYLKNMQINAGHSVISSEPYGDVIIKDGSKLILNKDYGVILDAGFECPKGGELEIK